MEGEFHDRPEDTEHEDDEIEALNVQLVEAAGSFGVDSPQHHSFVLMSHLAGLQSRKIGELEKRVGTLEAMVKTLLEHVTPDGPGFPTATPEPPTTDATTAMS